MPDLSFLVVTAEAPAYASVPLVTFKLLIKNAVPDERIQSVILRSQIMINVKRRRYTPEAQARLVEVFGEPQRWGETLKPLLWTHAGTSVQPFTGSTTVDLPVPCTYDFEVVGTKYFDALGDGAIPLNFLFSGTIFYEGAEGNLQVAQISWSKEANYRLPVAIWREMIERHYPNSTFIRLPKDVFDQLNEYKMRHGLPTWEVAMTHLLRASGEEVRS